MRIKVFKNLYQTLSILIAVLFIDVVLLAGFIASLFAEQPNYGWIILVVIAATLCLFFIIGFYWMFQKVVIDESGVKVVFFNKVLTKYSFDEIENCTIGSYMKNPAIIIHTKDGKSIHVDKRNKTLKCLESYNVKYDE